MEVNRKRIYHINDGTGNGSNAGGGGAAVVLSTDFGDWLALPEKNENIVDEQIDLEYKLDLMSYPDKAILYLVGQFGLNSEFEDTEITLGILPNNTRPKSQWKQYFICQNIECYFLIETTGEVKLLALTGNLPVNTGDDAIDPYNFSIHYQPEIGEDAGSFTATRTQNFTRNNCAEGYAGSVVSFSKTYNSAISQADANAQRTADAANFVTEGQANANAGGICTLIPIFTAERTENFTRNNCAGGYQGSVVEFTKEYTSLISQGDADNQAATDPDFVTDGQANANADGTCSLIYHAIRTEDFTRNNCADGYTGSTVEFSREYSSIISQGDADSQAATDADFEADGQVNANADGICTLAIEYTAQRTENFTRNNCGDGYTGSEVEFTKEYTSIISQDDADEQAATDPDYNTEGQDFANDPENGTCEVTGTAIISIVEVGAVPQTGPTNKFKFKIFINFPLTEEVTLVFDASYETITGGIIDVYSGTLTLPAGSSEYIQPDWVIDTSPAGGVQSIVITDGTPLSGSTVTDLATGLPLTLSY